jgi:hypothetical protein
MSVTASDRQTRPFGPGMACGCPAPRLPGRCLRAAAPGLAAYRITIGERA